jgi:tetratricopeptide (TPR) repeat protein
MLAASVTVPNPPQEGVEHMASTPSFKTPPTPQNWRGVSQGLKDAKVLLHLGFFAKAEDELLQLLEFAPMEGKAWHLLGRCHQEQGRHDKALECFERAAFCYKANQGGETPPASARLARLMWDQGEKDEARCMLDTLLMQQPENASLLAMRQEWQADMISVQQEAVE